MEIESWLFEPRKEDKTRGLSTQRGDEIRDSSPKAESLPLESTFDYQQRASIIL